MNRNVVIPIRYLFLIAIGLISTLMNGSFLFCISIGIFSKDDVIREVDRIYAHPVLSFLVAISLFILCYIVTKSVLKRISREEVFIMDNEFGKFTISLSAVEDLITKVLSRYDAIHRSKVHMDIQDELLLLRVNIKVWEGDQMPVQLENINQEIKRKLFKIAGLKDNFELSINVEKVQEKIASEDTKETVKEES